MAVSDPKQPGLAETTEEKLRQEIEGLRRQLKQQQELLHGASPAPQMWRPSAVTIGGLFLAATALIVLAFFAGYVPLQKRMALIRREAAEREQALPRVQVIEVGRSSLSNGLELPGSIQAVTEAPILARASGYIRRRMVDIGDRVRAGQTLAEIEAPELDQQIGQAKAAVQVAREALEQSNANYERGKSNLELARVTAERWGSLVTKGAVSRQENDQYQAQYQAHRSDVQALDKAIAVQRSNVAAAEANLARLDQMQSYRVVTAPFDGVITVRDVDTGALVNAGNTILFRIAQTGTLRIYLNVPQANTASIKANQPAELTVANLPGRRFTGVIARTAGSLDPTTRTLLVEVHVSNPDGALLPGMYAQVNVSSARPVPPLLVPGDALIVHGDLSEVAVVRPDHTIHLQKIEVGRDYGAQVEVLTGLQPGDTIIPNPGDAAREGLKVDPVSSTRTR